MSEYREYRFTKIRSGREAKVAWTTKAPDAAEALNDYALHFMIGTQKGWEFDESNYSLVRYTEYGTIAEEVLARPILF